MTRVARLALWGILLPLLAGATPAAAYKWVYAFSGRVDGGVPNGYLAKDAAGNLYGTTQYGGQTTGTDCSNGCGVVFKLDPATHTETVLHTFLSYFQNDGEEPQGGVILDKAGNLYGAVGGGDSHNDGFVFKIDSGGNYSRLYTFCQQANCTDGQLPIGGLTMDASGTLYGVTYYGGTGCGVIYSLDSSGHESVLHAFKGLPDGCDTRNANLLLHHNVLYGVTELGGGGASTCVYQEGCGIVYSLSLKKNKYRVLHRFADGADGAYPYASLIRDKNGNLYGTTVNGGTSNNGVIFKIDAAGTESVVYSFGAAPDGANPQGPVMLNRAGSLYGTTAHGGTAGDGTLFVLKADGSMKTLFDFDSTLESGTNPWGALLPAPGGGFYAVSAYGYGEGAITIVP